MLLHESIVHDLLFLRHFSTDRETQIRSLGQEDSLEKEMATHYSSILGVILGNPMTEEPGGLDSLESQNSQTQLGY